MQMCRYPSRARGKYPAKPGQEGSGVSFSAKFFLLQISQQNQILDPSDQGSKDLHFSLCSGLHAARGEPFRAEKNFTCYLPESPGKPWLSRKHNRPITGARLL